MRNNLLDKLTWNFIHEKQSPNGIEYLKSVSIKLNKVLDGSLSNENKSYLNTALSDLREVNRYVNKLLGNIEELEEKTKSLEEENTKLKTKLEKLKKPKEVTEKE